MVEAYRQRLESIVDEAVAHVESSVAIECKHFFSGAAAYADERLFMTLTPVGLALKLPEAARTSLLDQGAKPLRYFPKAPVKKDYVVLPEDVSGDPDARARWIGESMEFVLSQPKPAKRKR